VCRGPITIRGTPHDTFLWRPDGPAARGVEHPVHFRDDFPVAAVTHFNVTCFRVFAPSARDYLRREDEFLAARAGGGGVAELPPNDPHPFARMLARSDELCNMCDEAPFCVVYRSCACACFCAECDADCVRVFGSVCMFCRVPLTGRRVVR